MNRKFPWLPVLLIALVGQWLIFKTITYIEVYSGLIHMFNTRTPFLVLNDFVVGVSGGLISKHYLNEDKKWISGVAASLFIISHDIYYDIVQHIAPITAYFIFGLIGAVIYDKVLLKWKVQAQPRSGE